ncbi:MAG: excinuclease ABC subunit UvrA, partial [Candidatus Sumerlaeia bacterium]|nr:excinuclease ABC subunit UvrA [Candidatus Sumerlaeia bacterium]
EGQRRYMESLSTYARQFMEQMPKPNVEHIEGLSPAISIEQKTVARNPRSTVGTVTEIYDYMRLLFANVATPHCPECGTPLERQTLEDLCQRVTTLPQGSRLQILAPLIRGRKGEYQALFVQSLKEGYTRAKIDGELLDLDPQMRLKRGVRHDVSLLVDRFVIRPDLDMERLRLALEQAYRKGKGLAILDLIPDAQGLFPSDTPWAGERIFSRSLSCPTHGPQIVELSPRMFSFNSKYGACEHCEGLGVLPEVDMSAIIRDETLSIEEGAVVPFARYMAGGEKTRASNWNYQVLSAVAKANGFKLSTPWNKLPVEARQVILQGTPGKTYRVSIRMKDGDSEIYNSKWEGLIPRLQKKMHEEEEEEESVFEEYLREVPCSHCKGARLKPESLAVTLKGRNISELTQLSLGDALKFFKSLRFNERQQQIAQQPHQEIMDRLEFLLNVGLHYLTLDRHAGTLSGGEAQRIRLATQIGSKLRGVLYVLDEPSIGLHQRDNDRLIQSLCKLRDLGNTVIVVEHDEQTIRTADYILDLGPGAGELGGELIAEGTPKQLAKHPHSTTGHFLAGREQITPLSEYRQPTPERWIRLMGAQANNLKNVDLEIPLGLIVGITGVSGSGKSSLILETLVPALQNRLNDTRRPVGLHSRLEGLDLIDKLINVDQTPIGRTPRSNPATYTKVWDDIRDLFALTNEAKMRGYAKGRFSFNVKGGRCEECKGDGLKKLEMHFLPDVYVRCDACDGRRYNRETLEVTYKDKTINDVLNMTIDEALEFFKSVPMVAKKLQTLQNVGLGYITLGQQANTFSGGEAQRIKLAKELAKRNTGKTLYVLDEPTTGLHFEDVRKLIHVFNMLVAEGSTVIVIEHHLDIIKCCDYVIDLGPEGGAGGGEIIAKGTPKEVANTPHSITGRYLKPLLH